ncbi:polymer-forming cytoskeletal protein [bacterium]|nr:polymer-forming cytoskeletal protein [bacterium]
MLFAASVSKGKNRTDTTALIGEGSYLEGKFNFEGTGRVDGSFKGEIDSKDILIIGATAIIEAEVKIGKLVVEGTLKGNVIAAEEILIHSTGKIYGNITTPALIIEKGAILEGVSHMEKKTEPEEKKQPQQQDNSKKSDKK